MPPHESSWELVFKFNSQNCFFMKELSCCFQIFILQIFEALNFISKFKNLLLNKRLNMKKFEFSCQPRFFYMTIDCTLKKCFYFNFNVKLFFLKPHKFEEILVISFSFIFYFIFYNGLSKYILRNYKTLLN